MTDAIATTVAQLIEPTKLWSREQILGRPSPVPHKPGVYAWYFKEIPPTVPTEDCVRHDGLTLLYVGISPKAPPKSGTKCSSQDLCTRLRYHMNGNAEGSTLRLTLGVLLGETLGIKLRRVGSGTRMTFGLGEATVSDWLATNAFVACAVTPEPWVVEEEMIKRVSLPLNLDQNRHHGFHARLTELRRAAKTRARELPVVSLSG